MNKSKILAAVVVVLLIIIMLTIVKNLTNGDKALISPSAATPDPTPAYNPPKEIKFDNGTDLRKELETIDPQVLDSDFEE